VRPAQAICRNVMRQLILRYSTRSARLREPPTLSASSSGARPKPWFVAICNPNASSSYTEAP